MILRLARLFLRAEIDGLRGTIKGIVLILVAGAMAMLALIFGLIASTLLLSQIMPVWLAALIMAAAFVLASVILWLAGRALMRRKPARIAEIERTVRDAIPLQRAATEKDSRIDELSTVLLAAVVTGLVIGRRLSK